MRRIQNKADSTWGAFSEQTDSEVFVRVGVPKAWRGPCACEDRQFISLVKSYAKSCLPCVIATLILLLGCSDKLDADGGCVANVDCPGKRACVLGECIDDAADCQSIGAFADVTTYEFDSVDTLSEAHVTIDDTGAAHFCYWGYKDGALVTKYVKQTAWDTFKESDLAIAGAEQVKCGAIEVSSEGVPFMLSRTPPGLVFQKGDQWLRYKLEGLQGLEAKGAVAGDDAVIHLTPDANGGMYLAMSLGYDLTEQPVYLVYFLDEELTEIKNGWVESGTSDFTGYAPQFVCGGDDEPLGCDLVMADLNSHEVRVYSSELFVQATIHASYPKVVALEDGTLALLHLDWNWFLKLSTIDDYEMSSVADFGQVGLDGIGQAMIPWELAGDGYGNIHMVYVDESQGNDALLYRTVDLIGNFSDATVLSDSLVGTLPGMQTFSVSGDMCGRATAAVLRNKSIQNDDDAQAQIGPVLELMESM